MEQFQNGSTLFSETVEIPAIENYTSLITQKAKDLEQLTFRSKLQISN